MKHEEVLQVLAAIEAAYPRFELTEERLEVWAKQLFKMDFKGVKKRLDEHILTKAFPPAIAEIAAFPKPENEFLKKMAQWEKEGAERIAKQQGKPKPRNPFR